MSFSTEIDKQTTQRFILVRLQPARALSDLTLEDAPTGRYGTTFTTPYLIDSVSNAGVAVTETTANPPTVTGTYYYDESTGVFKICLGLGGTPALVVMNHSIFLSSREGGVVAATDPVNVTGTTRMWEPRIATGDEPTIQESVGNIFAGVLSLGSTSISIMNADRWFQTYMSPLASFRDKPATIWLCLGTEENLRRVYTGRSRSVSSASDKITVEVYEDFSALAQSAFFGDTADEAIYLRNGVTFDEVDPRRHGQPCRLIAGKFSRWKTRSFTPANIFSPNREELDPGHMEEAVCTDYSSTISTTRNREWTLCRTLDGLLAAPTVPTRESTNDATAAVEIVFTEANWTSFNVLIGTTVQINSDYFRLMEIEFDEPTAGQVKSYWFCVSDATPTLSTSSPWTTHKDVELVITDSTGTAYFPIYGRDYVLSESTTSGGNTLHKIVFDDNFETVLKPGGSNFFGDEIVNGLDPGRHHVYYRVRPITTTLSHGAFLKRLVEDAGLTANAASFTAADAALDANVLMSVPWFDQTEYGTYRDYAEGLLEGTLGYLRSNTAGEVVYELVGATSASTSKTADTIRRDSVSVRIDYNDVVSEIVAYNSHDYSDTNGVGDSAGTSESTLAGYLHGVAITTQLRHYLDAIADRIDAIVAARAHPLVTCEWTTETEDLETSIGDDFTLETDQVEGGSIDVKVIAIERSTAGVRVTAAQLEVE